MGGGGGVVVHGEPLLDVWEGSEAGPEARVAQVDGQISHGTRGRQQAKQNSVKICPDKILSHHREK